MAYVIAVDGKVELQCTVPLHIRRRVVETVEQINVGVAVHNPLNCLLARLIYGILLTTRYWSDDPQQKVVVPSSSGRMLVVVNLAANEEVCVSLRRLVGFRINHLSHGD